LTRRQSDLPFEHPQHAPEPRSGEPPGVAAINRADASGGDDPYFFYAQKSSSTFLQTLMKMY